MTGSSYNSNIAALRLQRSLSINASRMERVFERLSSGQRINRASDDAAGLAVASSLNLQSRILGQGIRNGNDALSLLNVADGALSELSNVVGRLKELATQASSGSLARSQRISLDTEAYALTNEFNRLVSSTEFNGRQLLNGLFGQSRMQIGTGSNGGIDVALGQQLSRTVGRGTYTAAGTNTYGHNYFRSGDFNGDGKADVFLINADTGTGAPVFVRLGDGTGVFGNAIALGQIAADTAVTVGDVNNDGKDDLIFDDNVLSLQVMLSNGNGTFKVAQSINPGFNFFESELADFNNDGMLDLVAAGGTTVKVYLGSGNGLFQTTASATLTSTGSNGTIKAGDFDGDSKMDIVMGSATTLEVFRGAGNGTFGASNKIVGAAASTLEVGDFNHDGMTDVVYQTGSTVFLYKGSTSALLESAGTLAGSVGVVVMADMNNDGNSDILAQGAGNALLYLGNGDGSFANSSTTSANDRLVIDDLNNDGVLDLLSTSAGTLTTSLGNAQQSTGVQRFNLTTQSEARSTLTLLESLQSRIQLELGAIGTLQSRLQAGLGAVEGQLLGFTTASSRITSTDIAQDSAELTRSQILQNVTSALMAQANSNPRIALDLLQSA